MKLAVVVVTYSPGVLLEQFLDSLPAATSTPFEVVLADNGSTDDAPERAAERSDVTLVHTGQNLGYGAAANAGVRATDTEFVLISNPDITFSPGAIDVLLDAMARWPQAAAVGPQIVTPDGELYPSARELPSLGRGIGHALCGWWWPSNPWTRAYRLEHMAPVERTVGWLSGSCLLLRRAAFDEVGGFDPAYFMYFEDTDLGDRLGRAGWKNVYMPDAVATHVGGHATRREPARMQAAHHDSALRYLSRRYAAWWWFPLRLALRGGLAVRAALARKVPAIGEGARPMRAASPRGHTRSRSRK